tara:strand:- start:87 stop:521 length:435 start_codon:yes stop_codon:yes gene_type:complete
MKKVTWKTALTLVAAIGGAIIGKWAVSGSFTQTPEDKTKILMQAASEINANLPMTIDAETILFGTSGVQNKFIYSYELPNYNKDNLDINAFVDSMSPKINNFVCTTEGMKRFRDMEIVISYSYYDANKNQITAIDVDTKSCPKT